MFYQNHVFSFHCNILIQGHFGQVYKGTYQGKDVAVKLYTGRISAEQSKKFVQEGMILKEYNHPNIVRFIGIAAQKHPIMIVTEYVSSKNKSFNTYFFFYKTHVWRWNKKLLNFPQPFSKGICLWNKDAKYTCLYIYINMQLYFVP